MNLDSINDPKNIFNSNICEIAKGVNMFLFDPFIKVNNYEYSIKLLADSLYKKC